MSTVVRDGEGGGGGWLVVVQYVVVVSDDLASGAAAAASSLTAASITGQLSDAKVAVEGGAKAPSTSDVGVSTAVNASSEVVSQEVSYGHLGAAEWTGKTKTAYEISYGIVLGIYDVAASPPGFKTGCSVRSTASGTTTAIVKYTAVVDGEFASSAKSAAASAAAACSSSSSSSMPAASACEHRSHRGNK